MMFVARQGIVNEFLVSISENVIFSFLSIAPFTSYLINNH